MKTLSLAMFFVVVYGLAFAQNADPVTRQHWLNPYLYNPAAGAVNKNHELAVGLNNDRSLGGIGWLNYSQKLNKYSVLGINAGSAAYSHFLAISDNFVAISYAHNFMLKNNTEIRIGASPKYVYREFSGIFLHENESSLSGKQNIISMDAGAFITKSRFFMGLSVKDIFEIPLSKTSDRKMHNKSAAYLHTGYKIAVAKDQVEVLPSLLVQKSIAGDHYLVDFNGSVILSDKLTAGASFRTSRQNQNQNSARVNFSAKIARKMIIGLACDLFINNEEERGVEAFAGFIF